MGKLKNLATMLQARTFKYGQKPVFIYKIGGEWRNFTWEEMAQRVETIGRGLISAGISPGDRVVIYSPNRPEWAMADLAILSIGAVTVPIYPNIIPDQARFIVEHSGAKAAFLSLEEGHKALAPVRQSLSSLQTVILLGPTASPPEGCISLQSLESEGRNIPAKAFYDHLEAVDGNSLATIVYTSGTTGDPKGVMLTHQNILSNCVASAAVFPLSENDTCLSFLPLSHALERTAGLFTMLYAGATIAFAESLAKVSQNLGEVKPTFLISVPRVLEKMHGKILSEIEGRGALTRFLFRKASTPNSKFRFIWERLFYRKIRNQLGGELRYMICGGAAMGSAVGEFFRIVGFHILEGYGLTEASPIVSVNLPDRNQPGSVGLPLPGVEIKIAPDGEVWVKGPNIMKGYYRDETATAEVLEGAYLKTGDIGQLDANGFLTLTDRKKEILVTSGGKNIAPVKIENALKNDPLIEQVCVVGDGQKYVAALIVPSFAVLSAKAASEGFKDLSRNDLIEHPKVREWFAAAVDSVNRSLSSYETVKRFALLPEEFSVEAGEMTPTLKLRRKAIRERYANKIRFLF